MNGFDCPVKIRAGAGAVAYLAELGAKRVFVVTDPFFFENGQAQAVAKATGAEAVAYFSGIHPDPTVELAAEGTAKLREFGPDLIVALGGGSAMDCAKAMAWFSGTGAKLAAVPTTSGSGAEVTDFAVLTHQGVKHPLVDRGLLPDIAILDSDLVARLPPQLAADTGYDVIAHAVEAFAATGAGAFSDALAGYAFRMAMEALPRSFRGDRDARERMHQAASMAGMAFANGGLGLCHAMAHSLGGVFHIPHGRLNAILLPAVVEINGTGAARRYAELARMGGLGGAADTVALRNLKNALIRLRRELDLPETLAQAGIPPGKTRAAAPELVRAALEDPCCGSNPVPVTEELVRQLLEAVTGHG